jgi:hypothetical protein
MGDQGRKARAQRVDELYLLGLDAYSRSDLESAKSYWEETLRLDPRFEPAKEGLSIITKSLSVEERIREMQRLYY